MTERPIALPPVIHRGGRATITPFLDGVLFDPAQVEVMSAAYDEAIKALHDTGQPDIVQEVLAKRIVAIGKTGEHNPQCRLLVGFRIVRDARLGGIRSRRIVSRRIGSMRVLRTLMLDALQSSTSRCGIQHAFVDFGSPLARRPE